MNRAFIVLCHLCLECQSVHTHLFYHSQKSVATGRRKMAFQSDGLDEILDNELYFIEAIGLKDHLSPTRSNGLLAMVKQMRMYALAFKAKMA